MANLPYRFHTPVPRYFSDLGWLNSRKPTYFKTLAFLTWSFSKCNLEQRIVCWDDKEITLEPFEFICGRITSSEEMGLTQDEFRTQIKKFIKAGLLEKTPNSSPNRFTCYKWLTDRFTQMHPQQSPRPSPNGPPSHPHKRNEETKRPSDIKDDSLGFCGNVHNSIINSVGTDMLKELSTSSENTYDQNIDYFKFAAEFIFNDGSKIKEKVILRWSRDFDIIEVYKSLLYYKKMAVAQEILNPEAYVEACLHKRYWESDEMRVKSKGREALHKKPFNYKLIEKT